MPSEKPNVRTAEAEPKDELFEIEVPDGVTLEVETPAAEEAQGEDRQPEPKVKERPDKERAEAKPAKDKKLPASTRAEREKRKHYAELYEETAAERDKLEAELRARRTGTPVVTTITPEYRAALIEKANKQDTMGGLIEIMLDEQARRDQMWAATLNEERFTRHLQVSETVAKNAVNSRYGSDVYDRILKESGIKDAIQLEATGEFKDPAIARRIYTSKDPGMVAYELAVGKLEKEGRLDEVLKVVTPAAEVEIEDDDEPEPKGEREQPKKSAPRSEASDERRAGAREVIDRVSDHSSRPRGLQALKPAAPPKRGVTRGDLDRMAEKDPDGLATMFKANPRLKDWWLGGTAEA